MKKEQEGEEEEKTSVCRTQIKAIDNILDLFKAIFTHYHYGNAVLELRHGHTFT